MMKETLQELRYFFFLFHLSAVSTVLLFSNTTYYFTFSRPTIYCVGSVDPHVVGEKSHKNTPSCTSTALHFQTLLASQDAPWNPTLHCASSSRVLDQEGKRSLHTDMGPVGLL